MKKRFLKPNILPKKLQNCGTGQCRSSPISRFCKAVVEYFNHLVGQIESLWSVLSVLAGGGGKF